MATYSLIVLSRPTEGREAEYNDWYQNVHLAQVVTIPGFKSAQRFRLANDMTTAQNAFPYVAIYQIETDDLAAAIAELKARAGSESLIIPGALDSANAYASAYEPFGPIVRA